MQLALTGAYIPYSQYEKFLHEKFGRPSFPLLFVCLLVAASFIAWLLRNRRG